jgi:hypothetical protein
MFDEIGRAPDEPMERGSWLLYRGLGCLLWLAALGACLWKHGITKPAYPMVYAVMAILSVKWFAAALRSAPPTRRWFHDLGSVSWLVVAALNFAFVVLN